MFDRFQMMSKELPLKCNSRQIKGAFSLVLKWKSTRLGKTWKTMQKMSSKNAN